MFWNKKEDKQLLPDLPPLRLPDHPIDSNMHNESIPAEYQDIEPHTFPSMPENHESSDFSEYAIKDAVADDLNHDNYPSTEDSSYSTPLIKPVQPQVIESKSSIFIKLDKFQSAKKSLVILEQKVGEMENILKKIRETRLREEQELSAWEKEVSMVKPRIEEISKNLFDKII